MVDYYTVRAYVQWAHDFRDILNPQRDGLVGKETYHTTWNGTDMEIMDCAGTDHPLLVNWDMPDIMEFDPAWEAERRKDRMREKLVRMVQEFRRRKGLDILMQSCYPRTLREMREQIRFAKRFLKS